MEPIMYFVVNSDLNMGKGKIAAQVAHAAIESYLHSKHIPIFNQWNKGAHAKVVLKAPEITLKYLIDTYHVSKNKDGIICFPIYDLGRTQVEPGSLTVISFSVCNRNQIPELRDLKLL